MKIKNLKKRLELIRSIELTHKNINHSGPYTIKEYDCVNRRIQIEDLLIIISIFASENYYARDTFTSENTHSSNRSKNIEILLIKTYFKGEEVHPTIKQSTAILNRIERVITLK